MRLREVEQEINEIIRIIEEADDYKPYRDLVALSYRLREEREKDEPETKFEGVGEQPYWVRSGRHG